MKRLVRGDTLLSVAALALAATVVVGRETPTLELMEPPPPPAMDIDLSRLERTALDLSAPQRDPFARRSFAVPPPPAAKPAQQPPPSPPQLPFRYVGRMVDEGQTYLFLARGDEIFTAQPGQPLGPAGGQWRIDEITEREIVFTYLPLHARRSLPL
ncbi:MAG: hypothetical protein ACT4P4_05795 [Betaproteobacteria bacterium]